MSHTDAFPTEVLPRVRLAFLPTPIEPLPNLSRHLGGPDIFVKRDDQTGLATGGNKARKLEFLLAEALEMDADCVVTAGSTQSNHARQTAAAGRKLGLEPHLVLYGPGGGPPPELGGNLLIDTLLGAAIHWTEEHAPCGGAIRRVEAELKAAGKRPYVVPYGGSNAVGMMGFVEAMREAAGQMAGTQPFDVHVFATSSGGTQAGMILGAHLVGLPETARLLGISVDEREATLGPRVANLANDGARLLGLDWRIGDEAADINADYLGGGYAVVGELEREAIRLAARLEGLLIDPVYTGRAFGGMIDLIRRGELRRGERVLFWHTGGTATLFAFREQMALSG